MFHHFGSFSVHASNKCSWTLAALVYSDGGSEWTVDRVPTMIFVLEATGVNFICALGYKWVVGWINSSELNQNLCWWWANGRWVIAGRWMANNCSENGGEKNNFTKSGRVVRYRCWKYRCVSVVVEFVQLCKWISGSLVT